MLLLTCSISQKEENKHKDNQMESLLFHHLREINQSFVSLKPLPHEDEQSQAFAKK